MSVQNAAVEQVLCDKFIEFIVFVVLSSHLLHRNVNAAREVFSEEMKKGAQLMA